MKTQNMPQFDRLSLHEMLFSDRFAQETAWLWGLEAQSPGGGVSFESGLMPTEQAREWSLSHITRNRAVRVVTLTAKIEE